MMQMVIILEKNINKGVFLNIDKIESSYLNYLDVFHSIWMY